MCDLFCDKSHTGRSYSWVSSLLLHIIYDSWTGKGNGWGHNRVLGCGLFVCKSSCKYMSKSSIIWNTGKSSHLYAWPLVIFVCGCDSEMTYFSLAKNKKKVHVYMCSKHVFNIKLAVPETSNSSKCSPLAPTASQKVQNLIYRPKMIRRWHTEEWWDGNSDEMLS